MSVYGIEGTPGSGKTLYAISEFILPALKSGIPIYHNIEGLDPVKLAVLADVEPFVSESLIRSYVDDDGQENTTEAVRNFYSKIPHKETLLIIDEAQNYFSARDFKEKFSSDLIPYLSRHRHYGHTVVWITQQREAVDITFRRQTQYMYRLERLENFGLKNSSRLKMYEGWDSMLVPPFASKNFFFPKQLYGVYKSYVSNKIEEKRRIHNVFLSNKLFMFILILVCVALIKALFFTDFSLSVNGKKAKTKTDLIPSSSSTPPPSSYMTGESGDEELDFLCYYNTYKIGSKQIYLDSLGKKIEVNKWSLLKKCY